jgi:hypothetical protein
MDDNTAYNKAIAEELGLPQGKCIPHSLALALTLVVKNGFGKLPYAQELLIEAGAVITVITAGRGNWKTLS